jgi:heme A synthase
LPAFGALAFLTPSLITVRQGRVFYGSIYPYLNYRLIQSRNGERRKLAALSMKFLYCSEILVGVKIIKTFLSVISGSKQNHVVLHVLLGME